MRKLLSLLLFFFGALSQASTDTTRFRLPEEVAAVPTHFPWQSYDSPHPRLALALSGGGSRGFAHIGAIKALEEAGIPIAGIAGTSIGAVVGGLYAAGYSVQELEQMAYSIDWGDIFQDTPARKSLPLSSKSSASNALLEVQFTGVKPTIPPALSAGQKLAAFLVEKVNRAPYRGEPGFDHLRTPFRAVSVDLRTGAKVLFSQGDLSEALLASMALPLLIAPLQHDGQLLIDGGIVENIPVKTARLLGDVVFAVDATQPPILGPPPYEPWIIANQVTSLMQRSRYDDLIREADLVVTAVADTLGNLSFANIKQIIEAGYTATLQHLPALKQRLTVRPWDQDSVEVAADSIQFAVTENSAFFPELEASFLAHSLTQQACQQNQYPQRRQVLSDLDDLRQNSQIQDAWAESRGATLIFLVRPNPILQEVKISGMNQIAPDLFLEDFRRETGKPFDEIKVSRQLEGIVRAYRQVGNPLARIEKVSFEDQGRLSIAVAEGMVHEIQTVGQNHISAGRIKRDLRIQTGQRLDLEAIKLGIEELYGSGLFNTVRATIEDEVVAIKVAENPLPRLRLGAGFSSERHGRGFVELGYAALPGIGGSLNARAKYAELDENYSLTYRNLAIFETYLEGALTAESAHQEFYHYTLEGEKAGRYYFDRVGGSIHIGEQFRTWGRVLLGLRVERLRTDYELGLTELNLRRIFLRSEIDTQDRVEFPTSGRLYALQFEAAMPALGGEVAFNRMQFQLKNVQNLTHRLAVLLHLQGGICDQATPFSEWFRLGGEKSFYGLHEGEKAGRQMIDLRLELREDLISRFLADAYISVGADFGAIWEDLDGDVSVQDFLTGVGLSLALDTFLGPISITYGQLLENDQQPRRQQWYFNLGHRF